MTGQLGVPFAFVQDRVVAHHHAPRPATFGDGGQRYHDTQQGIDDARQAFPAVVVDDVEHAEPPAAGQCIRHEACPGLVEGSSDQRWLGSCGVAIGARVSNARLRPLRLRTVSRSSRYSRYTFFGSMPLPSRLNRFASRR